MQLPFYWITAVYDNIYPPCIVRLPKFHVMLLIPILNLTPCSSEINPAKPWISEKAVECPSQYFGVTRYAFISHLWCKLLLYHFLMEGIPKGYLFCQKRASIRERCWTSSGASLQKLCWTAPWNNLPYKYTTPSQLRKYLATVLRQSVKKKKEKASTFPTPFPPPHPCYILTILQNCQHDNSPKLSFMTRMSGQLVSSI